VKFRVKIQSDCSENGKQLYRGYFLPHPVGDGNPSWNVFKSKLR